MRRGELVIQHCSRPFGRAFRRQCVFPASSFLSMQGQTGLVVKWRGLRQCHGVAAHRENANACQTAGDARVGRSRRIAALGLSTSAILFSPGTPSTRRRTESSGPETTVIANRFTHVGKAGVQLCVVASSVANVLAAKPANGPQKLVLIVTIRAYT